MKAGMAILRPLLAETGAEPVGKVVIGTVKGDIHDIGKNIVGMMLEGAGFEVFDLASNTDAAKFLTGLDLHHPDMLEKSAPLNEEFGAAVGADAYCRDAGVAAEMARSLIDKRRASVA